MSALQNWLRRSRGPSGPHSGADLKVGSYADSATANPKVGSYADSATAAPQDRETDDTPMTGTYIAVLVVEILIIAALWAVGRMFS
jgi:hypothetical protein